MHDHTTVSPNVFADAVFKRIAQEEANRMLGEARLIELETKVRFVHDFSCEGHVVLAQRLGALESGVTQVDAKVENIGSTAMWALGLSLVAYFGMFYLMGRVFDLEEALKEMKS